MLTSEMFRSCYALLLPQISPLPSSSSFLSSSLIMPASASLLPSSAHHFHGSPMVGVASLYKVVAVLALLSLIPSQSPPSVTANMAKEADLQKMFKLRNENEWKSLWHQEKHVRCRDQLLNHMDWACQKDIYRLEKRFQMPSRHHHHGNRMDNDPVGEAFIRKSLADTVIKPWSGYVRRKREEKSITDECCSAAGCTWEEYAEYCPAHRRLQTRSVNKRK